MAEQGELLPGVEYDGRLTDLNKARFLAFGYSAYAVELLAKTMRDEDVDLDQRVIAATELLQSCKVPV